MPEEITVVLKFEGGDPDKHRIVAYEGSQSVSGFSRALVLTSHYLSTGKIRYRTPFADNVRFFIQPPHSGSLEFDIWGIINSPAPITIGGQIVLDITAASVMGIFQWVLLRAIGKRPRPKNETVKKLAEQREGDLEALTDACEPAILEAHSSIGLGVNNIVVIGNNNYIATFDRSTKEYVRASHQQHEELIAGNVSRLNVNQKSGGIYLIEEGRVVPFSIARDANPRTLGALGTSVNAYAAGKPESVSARVRRVVAPDGRIKKFIIYDAWRESELETA